METPDLFGLFVRPMQRSGLRYMISGSLASVFYGEYVILWKLEFFREGGGDKHLRDIRGMLVVNGASIVQAMLDRASVELGLGSQWQQAKAI